MINIPKSLLEATHRIPRPTERRRQQLPLRWWKERRRKSRVDIGMEISDSGISIAFTTMNESGQRILKTDFVAFDHPSQEWSLKTILDPLQQLVDRYRLQGQSAHVALGGDICVTRTFYGTHDEVDANCKELCDRSSHFLVLGRGPKVHCKAERMLDAKHKRAWVTLAQHELLEFVTQAIEASGLRLGRVEHTITTLCRIAGSSGMDANQPVLMVLTGRGLADLIISYQGQLLLEYRPSQKKGNDACRLDMWSDAINRHLKCLQRFLGSQLPKGHEQLSMVCIPGTKWNPTGTTAAQLAAMGLSPVNLSVDQVCEGLVAERPLPTNEMMAAIWLSRQMSELEPEPKYSGDLSTDFRPENRLTVRSLTKVLWPVAASIMLVVGIGMDSLRQKASLSTLEQQLDELQMVRIEAGKLNERIASSKEIMKVSESLRSKLVAPVAEDIVRALGRALPTGCWLKQISLSSSKSRIGIVGSCFTNDAIFEYVETLKNCGLLRDANVVATRSVRSGSGPAFEFELEGFLSEHLLSHASESTAQHGTL